MNYISIKLFTKDPPNSPWIEERICIVNTYKHVDLYKRILYNHKKINEPQSYASARANVGHIGVVLAGKLEWKKQDPETT